MARTLALIHTSRLFLGDDTTFEDLITELMPEVEVFNILDDSLLPQCMGEGRVGPALVRRMCAYVVAAEAAGADAALSLCSSLGPAIDVARGLVGIPVVKIDDAHTEKAVREAGRVGVLATVATTLRPTVALLREKAAALGKDLEVREGLAPAALDALLAGDRDRHDAMLLETASRLAGEVDVLLCAQASMTRLAPRLEEETGRAVLTSPRLAVEHTKRVLDGLA